LSSALRENAPQKQGGFYKPLFYFLKKQKGRGQKKRA